MLNSESVFNSENIVDRETIVDNEKIVDSERWRAQGQSVNVVFDDFGVRCSLVPVKPPSKWMKSQLMTTDGLLWMVVIVA
jgi:hypothetical protein